MSWAPSYAFNCKSEQVGGFFFKAAVYIARSLSSTFLTQHFVQLVPQVNQGMNLFAIVSLVFYALNGDAHAAAVTNNPYCSIPTCANQRKYPYK